MKSKIFRDEKGEEKLEEWYQLFEEKIDAPVSSSFVQTSHGVNHVLKTGDETKPPLICLHSMSTSSAHLVSELQLLLDHYHMIVPDLPGQSVRGLDIRFSYKDHSFANWLKEILDELGLEKIDLLGVSLGGFAALQFSEVYPEMVQNLILIVPAGIVRGSVWEGIKKMVIPSMLYQFNRSEERLRKFVDPLMTTWDDDWGHYIGDSFTYFKPDLRIPPLISDQSLAEWEIPTLVFAGEEDLSFPGKPMVQRLQFNDQIQTELMKECRHSPPTTLEFRTWLSERIKRFLKAS